MLPSLNKVIIIIIIIIIKWNKPQYKQPMKEIMQKIAMSTESRVLEGTKPFSL